MTPQAQAAFIETAREAGFPAAVCAGGEPAWRAVVSAASESELRELLNRLDEHRARQSREQEAAERDARMRGEGARDEEGARAQREEDARAFAEYERLRPARLERLLERIAAAVETRRG